jgi:hypothetical protein
MVALVTFIGDFIVSLVILYATYGLMRVVTRCVLWLVCSIRFGEGTCGVQGSAPLAKTRQPSLAEIEVYVRQARAALFAYERRMLCARSEMRELSALTIETIAQTRALIAQIDAIAAGIRCGWSSLWIRALLAKSPTRPTRASHSSSGPHRLVS